MRTTTTHRPRNLDAVRAASILYGDLGTSKAYVIGLAFALAGYASFWLIAAVSILTLLIGINYITICRYYPNGGGVYASVRHRSQIISMIGAFFLMADYLVTAALSALAAFSYLGIADPILLSCISIGCIGLLNYFGPRHTGTLASIISLFTLVILTILIIFSIPYLPAAWHNIRPLPSNIALNWNHFVGVIVALSGIEAIANATGVMKLDPGSTTSRPMVTKVATKAIITVIVEVAIYTSFFAFVAAAISSFEFANGTVNAPGNPNVRDYMLRYLGEVFVGGALGTQMGHWFGIVLSLAMAILLLSAVNTAINGLISLQYLMASDGEVPQYFQKLNRFGVPIIPLIMAAIVPIVLITTIKDLAGLASLYAIGFAGAIATNLGSTSTDPRLHMKKTERGLMFFSFLIMAAVEITLFIDKPQARYYALLVILGGLILRALSREYKEKRMDLIHELTPSSPISVPQPSETPPSPAFSILCPVKKQGKALQTALDKSRQYQCPLYLLFIREQEIISEADLQKPWEEDKEAVDLISYAKDTGQEELIHFFYIVSDSKTDIIAAYAMRLEVKQIIIDLPQVNPLIHVLRGDLLRDLRRLLPEEIQMSVIS